MKMNPRDVERWEKTRRMGRGRYVWLVGVIIWGLPTGVLWSLLMGMREGWEQFPIFLILGLIGFPLCGYFFGTWTWLLSEKRVQKAMQSD